jgi:predicted RNase H-like HicB family nuclease
MSAKSKKSAKTVDRPFDDTTVAKAKKIAERYQVILTCEEGQHWYGRGLELPNIHGDGRTVGQCVENTREALAGWVAYLLEEGHRPPAAAQEGTRTMQVNVRLSAEEKALLETSAKRKGFSGLSDFVRAAAIEFAK